MVKKLTHRCSWRSQFLTLGGLAEVHVFNHCSRRPVKVSNLSVVSSFKFKKKKKLNSPIVFILQFFWSL